MRWFFGAAAVVLAAWCARRWSAPADEAFADPPCLPSPPHTGAPPCLRFCRCDPSRRTWSSQGGREWCALALDDGCIFGDGVPRAAHITEAPCDWVSGRGPLQRPRPGGASGPCAPPPAACPVDRAAMYVMALRALDRGVASKEDAGSLQQLGAVLRGAGYNRSALLRLARGAGRTGYELPAVGQVGPAPAGDAPAVAQLAWLFGVGGAAERSDVAALLSEDLLEALIALGVLVSWSDFVFAVVQIFPAEGGLFFTDLPLWRTFCDSVYQLGEDSLALAVGSKSGVAALKGPSVRILDLCTGSGVQGISAARHARERGFTVDLTLVDVSARAQRFVAANLLLNGLEGKFVHGDLFDVEEARAGSYDLVLANPPFWPAEGDTLFQFGGSDGERVTRQIVRGALPRLAVGGLLFIVTPVFNEQRILERLSEWGIDASASSLVLVSAPMDVASLGGVGGYGAIPQAQLERSGIVSGSVHGLIMVRTCSGSNDLAVEPSLWIALMGCGRAPGSWQACLQSESRDTQAEILDRIHRFARCSEAT